VLSVAGGAIGGFVLALPLFLADANYQSSLESGEVKRIYSAATQWPKDPIRMARAAYLLRENGFKDLALEIATGASRDFPDSFAAWNELYLATEVGSPQHVKALSELMRLDPHNPNLK